MTPISISSAPSRITSCSATRSITGTFSPTSSDCDWNERIAPMPDALPSGAALLERQIAQLLDSADPSEAVAFWGRQFDLGLAWVHFPAGAGGLGLPREFQTVVSQRLSAAG